MVLCPTCNLSVASRSWYYSHYIHHLLFFKSVLKWYKDIGCLQPSTWLKTTLKTMYLWLWVSILAVRGPLEVLRTPKASWQSSADKHSVMWFGAPNRISLEVLFTSVVVDCWHHWEILAFSREVMKSEPKAVWAWVCTDLHNAPSALSRSGTWLHSAVSEWGHGGRSQLLSHHARALTADRFLQERSKLNQQDLRNLDF